MAFVWLLAGMILGGGIGHCITWLYLMNKYAGRPVAWGTIIEITAISISVVGALLSLLGVR